MKKLFLVILLVVMASAMALAQTPGNLTSSGAPGSAKPTVDVLGAHNSYGRGCAGCHAPHNGALGEGGNAITGTTTDPWSGSNALFGQDMGPLLVGATLDFSDIGVSSTSNTSGTSGNYTLTLPSTTNPASWTAAQYADVRGIVMCLACHDGVVAKGAMMQNWAYEQQIKALPSTYGNGNIPTLLGTGNGAYHKDHPVGDNATMSSALGSAYYNTAAGLTYTVASGAITAMTVGTTYSEFVGSYGYPAIAPVTHGTHTSFQPVNGAGVPYIVCTTCHNQHVMNVYAANTASPIKGAVTGTYATYFFVNGPYNINNVSVPATQAASTTQFCRQCHFGESNEANGGTLVTSF